MRKFANESCLQPSNLNVQNLIPSVMQHIFYIGEHLTGNTLYRHTATRKHDK